MEKAQGSDYHKNQQSGYLCVPSGESGYLRGFLSIVTFVFLDLGGGYANASYVATCILQSCVLCTFLYVPLSISLIGTTFYPVTQVKNLGVTLTLLFILHLISKTPCQFYLQTTSRIWPLLITTWFEALAISHLDNSSSLLISPLHPLTCLPWSIFYTATSFFFLLWLEGIS